jgi:hypothetical protein
MGKLILKISILRLKEFQKVAMAACVYIKASRH